MDDYDEVFEKIIESLKRFEVSETFITQFHEYSKEIVIEEAKKVAEALGFNASDAMACVMGKIMVGKCQHPNEEWVIAGYSNSPRGEVRALTCLLCNKVSGMDLW